MSSLNDELRELEGQWVAIKNVQIVAHAPSEEELEEIAPNGSLIGLVASSDPNQEVRLPE